MSQPIALVVSLNFNPGHFSHLVACFRMLERLGFEPYLHIHPQFRPMVDASGLRAAPPILTNLSPISAAVFWFPSLKNIVEVIRWRITAPHARIVYVLHEPFDSIIAYRESGFAWSAILRIILVSVASLPMVWLSNSIAVPSLKALAVYKRRYVWLNSNYWYMPLAFDDEAESEHIDVSTKTFFSYIGTIAADHAFDRFVAFAERAVSDGWLPQLRFLIATKNVIPSRERAIVDRLTASGRLLVFEGRAMSTDEINSHFSQTLVVWNAYNRSMQSGVLPKAYMFGCAAVALRRNANEFLDDRRTCVLIDDNTDAPAIRDAVREIDRNRVAFARSCRERFLRTFHQERLTPTLGWMLTPLNDIDQ